MLIDYGKILFPNMSKRRNGEIYIHWSEGSVHLYRQGVEFGTVGKLEQTRPLANLLQHSNLPFNVFWTMFDLLNQIVFILSSHTI